MKNILGFVGSYILIVLIMTPVSNACAEDLFVGKYVSESRANFGTDEYGKYAIEITQKDDGYMLSYVKDGEPLFTATYFKCSEAQLKLQGYHFFALPGEVQALCDRYGVELFYAENGIKIPAKGMVKGGVYSTQYYSNVQWGIYGFKKIK